MTDHIALKGFPAPWKVTDCGIEAQNGRIISEFFGREQGPAEDLMSASPEMYDALRALLPLIDIAQFPIQLANAKNAILKAENKSGCAWCEEGRPRIRSTVNTEILIHTDTPVGRRVCTARPGTGAEIL